MDNNFREVYAQQITSSSQYITCTLENGVIYQVVGFQGKQPIGVDNATVNESIALAEQYYQRLVEIGDIKLPKTQEEINVELLETIKSLQADIILMKGENEEDGHKKDSKPTERRTKNSGQSSTDE